MKITQSCPTLCDPVDYSPWSSPGKDARAGCHSLLQGIFLTQGLNLSLLHCRWILYHLSYQGSPQKASYNGFITVKFQRTEKKNYVLQKRVSCFKSTSRNSCREEMATHSSILAWGYPMGQRSLAGYSPCGCKELDTI